MYPTDKIPPTIAATVAAFRAKRRPNFTGE